MNSAPNAMAQTADFEFAALSEAKNYREALLGDFSEYLRDLITNLLNSYRYKLNTIDLELNISK